ncbi:response regulator [Desulfoluna butyratoxydans]|uniref:Signal transduction response regulator receiver domain n=1 Tax=Desulfoluna butyratoxydans TaxID=231438 RepID=A0A4U8YP18_9BACT|nr:response regulator [Desulfoluna butyratoxydans]VFQ43412.1 signal transduction response regulator receiver domain [Desulfoluna butyratoxydans]
MTTHVLLIDDEQEFVTTLAERLDIRGFATATAQDGDTGLSLIRQKAFDVVILDLLMPGMNGLETLKHIRHIAPDLPVILLTGHGSTREGMEGMRLGAVDYLMKPLAIEDLLDKLKEVVAS